MVTLFHTLLHFGTLFTTVQSPTASVAASIRTQGLSKSHFPALTDYLHSIYIECTHIHDPSQRGLYTQSILDLCVYGLLRSVKSSIYYSLAARMPLDHSPYCTYN